MKPKRLIFSIIAIIIIFSFLEVVLASTGGKNQTTLTPQTQLSPVQQSADIPKSLSIPKLNINTNVEQVKRDSQGRMDVPKTPEDTAWYSLGTRPGDLGSAVIDGHFDTVTGAPAVFYHLKNLTPGDEIDVKDNQNKTYKFKVTDVETYPDNSIPLEKIFLTKDHPRLNLITCAGAWDQGTNNYSERTVVYAELK